MDKSLSIYVTQTLPLGPLGPPRLPVGLRPWIRVAPAAASLGLRPRPRQLPLPPLPHCGNIRCHLASVVLKVFGVSDSLGELIVLIPVYLDFV